MHKRYKRELIGNEGKLLLDTMRRLHRRHAVEHLLKVLNKTHPADIAWTFRHLDPIERRSIFSVIAQTKIVGEFISELDQSIMLELVDELTPQYMATIVKEMDKDDAVDLLEALPEDMANDTRKLMDKTDREEVDALLKHDPETAGGLMSPDFMAFDEELTVDAAIKNIQECSAKLETSFYLYIIHGEEQQLSGVLSLRELLLHPPYRQLKNVMNPNVIAVAITTPQNEVAHIVSQYNFLAVPVVDSSYKLMGIVTVDDVIDVIREEATEDFLRMAGAGKDKEILLKPVLANAKIRAPWLLATMLGGVAAALIITSFEDALTQVLALAAFMPVVAGMGGNIGTQSSTIVVRGIATGRVNMDKLFRVIFKEMRVGLTLGTAYGILLGLLAWFGYGEPAMLGVVVGLSILMVMIMAASFGAAIPLVLRRLNVDAAVATGPLITTIMDVMGITGYFIIAKILLGL